MVYYIGSLRKIRFNRNILYCKFSSSQYVLPSNVDLIGTFCIVNEFFVKCDKNNNKI